MKRSYVWTKGATPPHQRILNRLIAEGVVLKMNACWVWPGSTRGRGEHKYGAITVGSRQDDTKRVESTHVVMFEAVNGPVPDGLEIDHACQVKLCCNPRHLRAVTHQLNNQLKPLESKMRSADAASAARTALAEARRAQ